jgi:hypothetical protein
MAEMILESIFAHMTSIVVVLKVPNLSHTSPAGYLIATPFVGS